MMKLAGITLILVIIIFFHGVSFGEQLEKGMPLTYFSQGLIYSQGILYENGDLAPSLPEKAGSGNTLYGDNPIKAVSDPKFSFKPEVSYTMQSLATTDIQKKEISRFENGQLFMEKSSYPFGKFQLTGKNPNSSSNYLFSLWVSKYDENTLSSQLERLKESDIFKSLAILLELKWNF